jgi:hypothetical protein
VSEVAASRGVERWLGSCRVDLAAQCCVSREASSRGGPGDDR